MAAACVKSALVFLASLELTTVAATTVLAAASLETWAATELASDFKAKEGSTATCALARGDA